MTELIDTLWNVNSALSAMVSPPYPELIDTLWNVNGKRQQMIAEHMGINRYIMECKYMKEILCGQLILELIDTLWNVNYEDFAVKEKELGINRYIMECKYLRAKKKRSKRCKN